jgi:UDP:flavonoid glycosyltransferase YjiC (YdhE family)
LVFRYPLTKEIRKLHGREGDNGTDLIPFPGEYQYIKDEKMSTLLFTTLPSDDLGLLTRSLPIAKQLNIRGHEAVFSSPARAPGRLIGAAGFRNLVPHHPIYDLMGTGGRPTDIVRFLASSRLRLRYGHPVRFLLKLLAVLPRRTAPATPEVWNMGQAGAQMGMLDERFVDSSVAAYLEVIREVRPAAVVDFWNPFAVIAARAAGISVISVLQADAHPAGRGFIWWKDPPAGLPDPVPVLNRVMARRGLEPIGKFEQLSLGDLTLVVGGPETDPLPPEARPVYIGPVLWEQPGRHLPDWLARRNGEPPLIWVYSGNPRYFGGIFSPFDSIVVIRAAAAALGEEDVRVVLTTGHHVLPREVRPLPANFRHEPFLPGLAMARRSDLLIHHGGYGSCQTGLVTGTPAVILPTYSERESNARRVAALGAGEWVGVEHRSGKKSVDVRELRAAVRRVLADPAYAERAKRAGERLRSYGGAPRAAELMEDFLRERSRE